MTREFSERRVAITGAGSGLGRALALRYAGEGWRVAVTDRIEARAQTVGREVDSAGGHALVEPLDVTREADFARLCDRLQREWGGVDVFVNNAGVAAGGSLLEADLAQWQTQIEVNLLGVLRGCRAVMPLLLEQGSGHIVNVASFAGIACPPGMVSYNSVKAAVIALSESVRAEVWEADIGVTVACPAFFPTNLLENFDSPQASQREAARKMMERSGVTAEDVADGIVQAVRSGEFLAIAHAQSRQQYDAKRADPEAFFHAVRQSMQKFSGANKRG